MPIWLRKFTFHEINQFYKDEAEAVKKSQDKSKGKKTMIDPQGKVRTPSFKKPTKSSWR